MTLQYTDSSGTTAHAVPLKTKPETKQRFNPQPNQKYTEYCAVNQYERNDYLKEQEWKKEGRSVV